MPNSSSGTSVIIPWLREKLVDDQCPSSSNSSSSNSHYYRVQSVNSQLFDFEVGLLVAGYLLLVLLAIIGNIFTIKAFVERRFSSCSDDVRLLLANLCVVHLLSAIFYTPLVVVYQLVGSWVFPTATCPIVFFLQVLTTIEAILTHVAIGANRFWAIFYWSKRNLVRGVKVHLLTWLLSICFALPTLFAVSSATSSQCVNGSLSLTCSAVAWSFESEVVVYSWTLLSFLVIATSGLLFVVYVKINHFINEEREQQTNNTAHNDPFGRKSVVVIITDFSNFAATEPIVPANGVPRQQLLNMVEALFVLFALTFLPLHVFLVSQPIIGGDRYTWLSSRLYWGLHWLSASTVFQAPLVYYCFRRQFHRCLM